MCPVESEADRASFFDAEEFAQVAEIDGREIEGFFDEPTEFLEDLGPVAVQTTAPTFQCRTSEIPSGIAEGEPITIARDDGSTFSGTVVTVEPDGFGLSLIRLQDDE